MSGPSAKEVFAAILASVRKMDASVEVGRRFIACSPDNPILAAALDFNVLGPTDVPGVYEVLIAQSLAPHLTEPADRPDLKSD